MIDRILKILQKLQDFVMTRTGLSMVLAFQIFVGKTVRTRPRLIVACTLFFVFAFIGIHTGMCPVKYTLTTLYAKLNLG